MDEASVEAAFTLIDGEGTQATPVEGEFRWNDDSTQMTFDPSEQLMLDTLYQITLDAEQG